MVEAMAATSIGGALGAVAVSLILTVRHSSLLPVALIVATPVVMVGTTGVLTVPIATWLGRKDPIAALRMP